MFLVLPLDKICLPLRIVVNRIVLIDVLSEVIQDFLDVELRFFLQLCYEDCLGNSDLSLTFFKVLTIFRIEQLGITTLDFFIIEQEALIVD